MRCHCTPATTASYATGAAHPAQTFSALVRPLANSALVPAIARRAATDAPSPGEGSAGHRPVT